MADQMNTNSTATIIRFPSSFRPQADTAVRLSSLALALDQANAELRDSLAGLLSAIDELAVNNIKIKENQQLPNTKLTFVSSHLQNSDKDDRKNHHHKRLYQIGKRLLGRLLRYRTELALFG